MDTIPESPVPHVRTDLQAQASRANGSKSLGPVTTEGKALASGNAVTHGLSSQAVLLPSETAEDYQANVTAWAETLKPTNPGEAEVVTRVADLVFRQRRLQRLEDRHMQASLEARLTDSSLTRSLTAVRNAQLGLRVMVETLGTLTTDCPSAAIKGLLAPIEAVMGMLEALELPVTVSVPLEAAHRKLEETATGAVVPVEVLTRLTEAGTKVLDALAKKMVELEASIEVERIRLADEVLLGEDKEMRRFERHKAMISKQLDAELARLKTIRELSQTAASGSFCGPILVELKLVGRR
jgi:hypothetical protein